MNKKPPTVYFARGVDDLVVADVIAKGKRIAARLAKAGVQTVDPVAELAAHSRTLSAADIVEYDLDRLRRADAVFMDMSVGNRNYVGCCCELVYAYQWRIPVVVYVGRSGNERRHWLQYHATGVHTSYRASIAQLLAELAKINNGE